MQTAERLTKIPPYLFMELRKKIAKAKADGVDVISLAIGDPVEPTPDSSSMNCAARPAIRKTTAIRRTKRRACSPSAQEVARWYQARYGVTLNPADEILGLIGSKEGCHHFILARVNPGRYRADDRSRLSRLPLQHPDGRRDTL